MLVNDNTLSDILDDCLQKMSGGQSLDECLSLYPQQAEELAPLLRTATLLQDLPRPHLSSQALEAGERQFLNQAAHLRRPRTRRSFLSLLLPGRRWAIGLTAILLLAFFVTGGSAGLVYAAANSLPGDSLYGVKLLQERFTLALASRAEDRVELHLALAGRRLEETAELARRGRPLDEAALSAIQQEAQAALIEAQNAGVSAEALLTMVEEGTRERQEALEQIRTNNPAEQTMLIRAGEAVGEEHMQAVEALRRIRRETTPIPTGTPAPTLQPTATPVEPTIAPATPTHQPPTLEPTLSREEPTPEKKPTKEKSGEQKPAQENKQEGKAETDTDEQEPGQNQEQGSDQGQGQGSSSDSSGSDKGQDQGGGGGQEKDNGSQGKGK